MSEEKLQYVGIKNLKQEEIVRRTLNNKENSIVVFEGGNLAVS